MRLGDGDNQMREDRGRVDGKCPHCGVGFDILFVKFRWTGTQLLVGCPDCPRIQDECRNEPFVSWMGRFLKRLRLSGRGVPVMRRHQGMDLAPRSRWTWSSDHPTEKPVTKMQVRLANKQQSKQRGI
jgi:hypothetical protein